MKYYGKAEQVVVKLVEAFSKGEMTSRIAWVFCAPRDIPCRKWSYTNQIMTAIMGYTDARGIRQWNQVGRKVKKGESGFPILVPMRTTVADKQDPDKTISIVYGFKSVTVFGYEQTEGDPLPYMEADQKLIEGLPFVQLAERWGLSITVDPDLFQRGAAGSFNQGQSRITMAVNDWRVWLHELVHAADARVVGPLKPGQHWDQEVVADLGAATLLSMLGQDDKARSVQIFEYIKVYAGSQGMEVSDACAKMLKRTCSAVELIMTESGQIETVEDVEMTAS